MHRRSLLLALLASLSATTGRADEGDLPQALALQRVMQKVIAGVEPSVACILVSRSEAYPRPTSPAGPGQLGGFDPNELPLRPNETREDLDLLRKKLDLANPSHVPQSFGSGLVIDAKGLVLTSNHVVQDATKIFVRLPGGVASYADIHAADPRSDLAVLRLLTERGPLPAVTFGDAERLERGQLVLTIANPFAAGFRDGQPSASWGIVSNLRRRAAPVPVREEERAAKPLHQYSTLIQTDARLNLGCSGGALVNLQGEVVGLTTALAALQGGETPGGFAMPLSRDLRRIVEVLARGEEVEYGFLGVNFQERAPDASPGVVIGAVVDGSPAKVEGRLQANDVLLAINGRPVRDSDDLFVHLGTKLADSKVRLLVRRVGREPTTVEVTLARLYVPGQKIASSLGTRPFVRGLRVDHASLLVQQPPRMVRQPAGVLVSAVQPASAAERALLKAGEVVTHVNGQPVTTPAAFYQAVAERPGATELTLYNFNPPNPPAKILLK